MSLIDKLEDLVVKEDRGGDPGDSPGDAGR